MRVSRFSIVCTLGVVGACSEGSDEPYVGTTPTVVDPAVTAPVGPGSSASSTVSDVTGGASTSGLVSSEGATSDGTATDGTTTAGTTSEPTAGDEPFKLLFRDEFDSLDKSRWQLMTHSWGGNLAVFSDETATIEDGHLFLRLLPAPEGTYVDGEDKLFLGAEVRSKATLTYGRVRARMRFPRASAVVSSLVTIYTPWPADNWNELDIESLGKDPNEVQFNTMIYDGPPVEPPVTTSVSPTQDPHMEVLGFDSSLDFHEYTIEWTPEAAKFFVDGEQRYSWSKDIARMTLPQNVLLTIWASDTPSWAGPVTEETAGATVVYDWVELWQYVDPTSAQGE